MDPAATQVLAEVAAVVPGGEPVGPGELALLPEGVLDNAEVVDARVGLAVVHAEADEVGHGSVEAADGDFLVIKIFLQVKAVEFAGNCVHLGGLGLVLAAGQAGLLIGVRVLSDLNHLADEDTGRVGGVRA